VSHSLINHLLAQTHPHYQLLDSQQHGEERRGTLHSTTMNLRSSSNSKSMSSIHVWVQHLKMLENSTSVIKSAPPLWQLQTAGLPLQNAPSLTTSLLSSSAKQLGIRHGRSFLSPTYSIWSMAYLWHTLSYSSLSIPILTYTLTTIMKSFIWSSENAYQGYARV